MGSPGHQSSGCSDTPINQHSNETPATPAAEHAIEKQQQHAIALVNQGKLQEAETIYRKLISAGIKNHVVYGNLAAILGMQGRLDDRIKLLTKALQLKPNYVKAHTNLGNAFQEKGDLNAAIASYKTSLELKPNDTVTHYNLGLAFQKQGDLPSAINSYRTALELNPNHPETNNNLGLTFQELGDTNAAINSYKNALKFNPDYPAAHYNLGISLKDKGDLAAAIEAYNKAIQLKPNYPEAHTNLGNALQKKGDLNASIKSFRNALKLKPQYAEAHFNLGIALREQGDLKAAIASFNKAIQIKPDNSEAHWSCALTLLLSGDYKNGWAEYEYRFQRKQDQNILSAHPSSTQWNGQPLLPNSTLLLVSEQGLGDTLQFMRYALALKSKGISIALCAQPKLHSLIQASGIDSLPLTPEQANQVTEGQWIPLLSIPRLLKVNPNNPIVTSPYIKTTNQLQEKWNNILSNEQKPIIGVNWQGNPNTEKTGLRGRSLALETFAPLVENNQISLLSLQKGYGSEQLQTCSFKENFVSCQNQIDETWDFLETAAIISNCDLIITCDTSVAHLAGGMGKATWLLLHKVPEWRWGLEGETTFWYPSIRLFRQTERGNWNKVIEKISEALQEKF